MASEVFKGLSFMSQDTFWQKVLGEFQEARVKQSHRVRVGACLCWFALQPPGWTGTCDGKQPCSSRSKDKDTVTVMMESLTSKQYFQCSSEVSVNTVTLQMRHFGCPHSTGEEREVWVEEISRFFQRLSS